MAFWDIVVISYVIVLWIAAVLVITFAPCIVVAVFDISKWWVLLTLITIPIGGAMIVWGFGLC